MKISERTKQILKNYSGINQNVILHAGNKIRTISAAKTVYGEVEVEETFPAEFGIYDLNEFLGVIGLFKDPDINITEKVLTVSDGKNSVRYLSADPSVLIAPKKALSPKEPVSSFKLPTEALNSALKAAGVLKSPVVSFTGDGSNISLIAHDKANANSNSYSVEVAENSTEFQFHVKTEYLGKLLSEEFDVEILDNKLLIFKGEKKLYMIAAEADSTIVK